ncbi:MAG: hypothetical protein LUI05_09090 [Oscillospiraceae bacterium]|nr:hypothetical protein [Oscillospiraceae bacterium]
MEKAELYISQALGDLKTTLLQGAAAALVSAVLAKILLPKPTKIIIDEGIPAELVTIGKKDNPKAVYVSSKKHSANIAPAVILAAAAVAVSAFKKRYDEDNNIINAESNQPTE